MIARKKLALFLSHLGKMCIFLTMHFWNFYNFVCVCDTNVLLFFFGVHQQSKSSETGFDGEIGFKKNLGVSVSKVQKNFFMVNS